MKMNLTKEQRQFFAEGYKNIMINIFGKPVMSDHDIQKDIERLNLLGPEKYREVNRTSQ